jgi:diguanylate cyclase (GGDEF)-like protein
VGMAGSTKYRLYSTAVIGASLAMVAVLAPHGVAAARDGPAAVWMLIGAVVVAAALVMLPGHSEHRGSVDDIGLAIPCAFALQLAAGTPIAVAVLAVAMTITALWRRPASPRLVDVAGAVISLSLAGIVMRLISGTAAVLSRPATSTSELIAVGAGGVIVFAVVVGLMAVSTALEQRISVAGQIPQALFTHLPITGVLLALAPSVVIVAELRPLLLPVMVFPIVAVYRNAHALLAKEHLALHDALTGLPNRRLFMERLGLALQEAAEQSTQVAVLLIDLDRFKEVNDQLGHHAGDVVLQAVGPAIADGVGEDVTVARLGGDEFAVCVPDVDGADEAVRVAKGILSRLGRPIVVDGYAVDIGASVGVALYPGHAPDVSSAMQRADIAMYVAKETRGGYEVYSPERDPHRRQRVRSPSELRRATELGQLVLHYQPKVDMGTGDAKGVEALVRWNHPELGLIGPGEFIPLAERAGLMQQLTTWVLARGLEQCQAWTKAGYRLRLAVNLSVQSLYDDAFPGLVAGLLERSSIAPEGLVLDVTESTVMADPRRAQRVLAALGAIGVTLAIDDFGTGYSSLAYLRQLPVSELKIDKSFVLGMATDSDDAVIVHSTIDLGQKFGLEVVAEGVESRRVWRLLHRLGCDLAQGSYVCSPLPAAQLTGWLHSNATNSAAATAALPADVPHSEPVQSPQ